MQKSYNDIQFLETNLTGKDYIIGDVHGALGALEKVINQLQPKDRLFIVGDLIDRGDDSLGVITFINEHNKDQSNPRIYVAQGNHEQDFLNIHAIITKNHPDEADKESLSYFLQMEVIGF